MITHLLAHNFRGLRDANLQLSPRVTIVLGLNGSGKSSLAEAVAFGLMGACEWTDKRGAGSQVLIGRGGPTASVEIAADFGIVSRSITAKGQNLAAGGRTGKDAQAALNASLPADDLLLAMLRSDGFIGLPSKEQQDLLFSLSGGETGAAWFKERLEPAEVKVLDSALATLLNGSTLADSLYDTAYALRTDANKRAKSLKAQADADDQAVASRSAQPSDANTDALGQQLQDLRDRQGVLQGQIGAAAATLAAHEASARRVEAAEADVKRLQEALAGLGERPALAAGTVADLEADVAAKSSAYSDAIQLAAEINAVRETLQEQLDEFKKLKDQCVLGELVCPLEKPQRADAIKRTQKKIDEYEKLIADAHQAATEAETAHKEAVAALHEARETDRAHEQWLSQLKQLNDQLEQAEERRGAACNEILELNAPDVADVQAELLQVQEQIADAEAAITQAREHEARAAEIARVQKDLAEATDRASMLDALVKKLSPDGLPAQAMRETVGCVVDAINAVLAEFTEISLSLETGKDAEMWADLVNDRGESVHLPVRVLCESEKLRVGAAIQVAFARLTEFGFVVVDAADRLDSTNRGPLLGMLLRSEVQALVLATPANRTVPHAEGLTTYCLEGGVLAEPVPA